MPPQEGVAMIQKRCKTQREVGTPLAHKHVLSMVSPPDDGRQSPLVTTDIEGRFLGEQNTIRTRSCPPLKGLIVALKYFFPEVLQ